MERVEMVVNEAETIMNICVSQTIKCFPVSMIIIHVSQKADFSI